jgi:hypothetical protein
MERRRQLFRDYGLTLALLLAGVLIYWRTTQPALKKNVELDRRRLDLVEQREARRADLERLQAAEAAASDPIQIERLQRAQHGDLGLPPNERRVAADAPAAGDPATAREP